MAAHCVPFARVDAAMAPSAAQAGIAIPSVSPSEKTISLLVLTGMVVGSMIGAGIFVPCREPLARRPVLRPLRSDLPQTCMTLPSFLRPHIHHSSDRQAPGPFRKDVAMTSATPRIAMAVPPAPSTTIDPIPDRACRSRLAASRVTPEILERHGPWTRNWRPARQHSRLRTFPPVTCRPRAGASLGGRGL